MSSSDSSSYARAGPLIAACFEAFRPPDRVSVADWAAEHRYLDNQGGGYVGRWDHTIAPYLVGIMDALSGSDHRTVAVVGPGQCGKTAGTAENWLGQQIMADQADVLWFMQTQDSLEAYIKKTINPLIDSHGGLLSRLGLARADNTLKFKRFDGMVVEFLAATPSNMINKRAPRIVADEFDAYDLDGDPKALLDVRRQTYGDQSKLLVISHPDRAKGSRPADWSAGVMAIYADSTRATWWWACPECGCFSSPNPHTPRTMVLDFPADAALDDLAEATRLVCPVNGCLIEDGQRRAMNLTGRWVCSGQTIDELGVVGGAAAAHETAGFWIMGVMSPFVTIGALARARVKAEREAAQTGDYQTLRTVMVKQWGVPYDPPRSVGSVDAATLAERADPALVLGVVPAGVRFITCGIDVQANRFELLFRGWGVDRESWVIETRVVAADPSGSASDWDAVLRAASEAEFPLADGSGRVMRCRGVGIDSAGAPGVTAQAYAAWRRMRQARLLKMVGTFSGRQAWTVMLLKGGSALGGAPLSVVMPDSARKDRGATARGEIPLGLFNPNWHKDVLAAQLARGEVGPGYVHVPAGLRADVAPHPWFEQLVAEERKPNGAWVKTAQRNEALDLMVMSAVVAHLFAPSRFDWTRPPPWAREWDQNPLVVRPATPVGATVVARVVVPATPAETPVLAVVAARRSVMDMMAGMRR